MKNKQGFGDRFATILGAGAKALAATLLLILVGTIVVLLVLPIDDGRTKANVWLAAMVTIIVPGIGVFVARMVKVTREMDREE